MTLNIVPYNALIFSNINNLNCRYRQCNLLISKIRVADIRNSKCLYRQWVLNDDSAYHIGKVVSAQERCKICRLPWEQKLQRLQVILQYTTGTMFRYWSILQYFIRIWCPVGSPNISSPNFISVKVTSPNVTLPKVNSPNVVILL